MTTFLKLLWQYRHYVAYVVEIIIYLFNKTKKKPMKPHVKIFIEKVVDLLDKKTDTGWMEPIDGPAAKKLLIVAYNYFENSANPKWVEIVDSTIKSLIETKDDELIAKLTEIINGKIDFPHLDETEEAEVIKAILTTIAITIRGLM